MTCIDACIYHQVSSELNLAWEPLIATGATGRVFLQAYRVHALHALMQEFRRAPAHFVRETFSEASKSGAFVGFRKPHLCLTCYGRISWYHLVTWVSDMVSSQHMHVWWCFACMFSEGSMFHYFSYGLHPGSFSLSLLLRGGLLLRGARHHSGRAWLLISPRRQRREAVMVFDVFWVNVWIIMLV